jgi:hypothetical protein
MKKPLLVLILLFTVLFTARAQDTDPILPRLSIGAGFGGAVGGNTSNYPVGIQLNARYEYPISDSQLAIVAATGLSFFTSSTGYSANYNTTYGSSTSGAIAVFVPAQLGVRYYISKLFVEGDAGVSFNVGSDNANTVTTYNYTSGSSTTTTSTTTAGINKTAALITPSIGYGFRWGSTQKIGLDLSAGYEARLGTPSGGDSFSLAFFKVAFSLGL